MASTVAAWPTVALGEVLQLDIDAVPVDTSATYPIAGVYSFGRGLLTRQPLLGSETTYKVFHRLHTDQFVLSQLKAWEGALARVPAPFDGWFLSPQFPTFRANNQLLDSRFLDWYCRQSRVWETLRSGARGMGARRDSVSPARFLSLQLPLPPLEEQRRIVARIEALAGRIAEARGLRQAATAEGEALWRSALGCAFAAGANVESVPLEFVCSAIIDNLHSDPVYADSGVPCVRSSDVGWGTLHLETARRTSEEEYQRRTIRGEPMPGDIVLVREGGGTGKAALVAGGQRFSLGQRVMMLRPDIQRVLPQFLLYQLLSPAIYDGHIVPLSKGSASPHLNIGTLRRFSIQLPSLNQQGEVVAGLDTIRQRAGALRQLQEAESVELDALLPAILDQAFRGEL